MKASPADPLFSASLSRRDFLRLGLLGLGFFFPLTRRAARYWPRSLPGNLSPRAAVQQVVEAQTINPGQQGRVLNSYINVHDQPTFSAQVVNTYWRDRVIPITQVTVGSLEDSHNIVWYRIGDEGYAHSGAIQPVLTLPNPVVSSLPEAGALAEVTVPFTDARLQAGYDQRVAYRFYYGTTHWVIGLQTDANGETWYRVIDDKWEYLYAVPAAHLHILTSDELTPLSPDVPPVYKRLEVHIPDQVMIAYEYNEPVFITRVASGAIFTNGNFSTPLGRFLTFHKRGSRHMAAGNLAANGYDLPGVPWNCYITEGGIAFHGTYWHNNFGRPRSHGCINLTIQAANWLYRWSMPSVAHSDQYRYENFGTPVDIIG
jgi:lipoprotein-anchoring transpeptidase ErfK/SrfK